MQSYLRVRLTDQKGVKSRETSKTLDACHIIEAGEVLNTSHGLNNPDCNV